MPTSLLSETRVQSYICRQGAPHTAQFLWNDYHAIHNGGKILNFQLQKRLTNTKRECASQEYNCF
jgi:hypothetical protein